MTEPGDEHGAAGAGRVPVAGLPARRDGKLTIPSRRLRGSPACLNCGTPLQGPFCHYCGQPDRNLVRFFPVLMRELLADFVDFDSRFMRTMRPLLFHPGKLTRDYLEGRRFRYTPPLRLYIFASAVFFVLAAMLAGSAVDVSLGNGLTVSPDEPQQAEERDMIIFGDEPWDRETNPVVIPGLPGFVNDWINDEIAESPRKQEQIQQDPNLIVDQVFDVMPIAVFAILPIVALLFKFWYLFARRYYVEHLIHALHNHAFLFVVFTLTLLADSVAQWLDPAGSGRIGQAASAFTAVMLCWIPLYLLISLKTVYRQGWLLTFAKFSVIGLSYLVLLAMASGVVAGLSFLLL